MKEDLGVYDYENYYMQYCEAEANKMYPEVYYRIIPYVKRKCEIVDNEYNQMMNPFPKKETINRMVEEIHAEYNNDHRTEENSTENYKMARIDGYIGRDLITVILLGELLSRRRRRFGTRRFPRFGGFGRSPFFY